MPRNALYKTTGAEGLYDRCGQTCPAYGIQIKENVFCYGDEESGLHARPFDDR